MGAARFVEKADYVDAKALLPLAVIGTGLSSGWQISFVFGDSSLRFDSEILDFSCRLLALLIGIVIGAVFTAVSDKAFSRYSLSMWPLVAISAASTPVSILHAAIFRGISVEPAIVVFSWILLGATQVPALAFWGSFYSLKTPKEMTFCFAAAGVFALLLALIFI